MAEKRTGGGIPGALEEGEVGVGGGGPQTIEAGFGLNHTHGLGATTDETPGGGKASLLDDWLAGSSRQISAGDNRLAWLVLSKEDSAPISSFGTVTWGGQTVEKQYEEQVGGFTNNQFYIGILREAAIAQMNTDPITTSGDTPGAYITGSYQDVQQTNTFEDSCVANSGDQSDIIVCNSAVTALTNQPIIAFSYTSSSTSVVSNIPSGFNQSFNQSIDGAVHSFITRPAGAGTTVTPFVQWDITSSTRFIVSAALRWSGTTGGGNIEAQINFNTDQKFFTLAGELVGDAGRISSFTLYIE